MAKKITKKNLAQLIDFSEEDNSLEENGKKIYNYFNSIIPKEIDTVKKNFKTAGDFFSLIGGMKFENRKNNYKLLGDIIEALTTDVNNFHSYLGFLLERIRKLEKDL